MHLASSWKLEFLELGNGLFLFSNFYLFFPQKTTEDKEESSGKKNKNKTDKRKTEQGDDEDKDAEDYEDGEAEKEALETEEDEEEDETDDKIEEMKKPKRKAAEEDESDLDSSRCVFDIAFNQKHLPVVTKEAISDKKAVVLPAILAFYFVWRP